MTNRYPKRGTRKPEMATPNVDARNCAVKNSPAWASLSDQRAERAGNTGPSRTVTTPVGTNAACATAVWSQ